MLDASGELAYAALKRQRSLSQRSLVDEEDFKVTNERAVEWAKQHAADTISGISKNTREDIRDLVVEAFEEQFTVDQLADEIEKIIGDETRAETIARTEVMKASNQGHLEAFTQATESGLLTGNETKEWIVTPDDRLCPVCEPMDGVNVPLHGTFDVDGQQIDGPPAHPNCRCTVALTV